MIKLTKNQLDRNRTRVRVEGRLDSEATASLHAFIAELAADSPIVLDLSGLASVDAEGLAALISLAAAGHELQGGSLYVNRLLKEAQS